MTKNLRVVAALFALTALLSCGKELSVDTLGTSPGAPNTVAGKITMTINGTPWAADRFTAALIDQGEMVIYGESNSRKAFIIYLDGTTTGEYILDQDSQGYAAWSDSTETNPEEYSTDQGSTTADAGGRVIVTKIDTVKKTVSGTFEFLMFRDLDNGKKTVVNGVFTDISYTGTVGTPGSPGGTPGTPTNPPATGNLMEVTFDGAAYKPPVVNGAETQGDLVLTGAASDGSKAIGLTMPVAITPGTYDLGFLGEYTALYVESLTVAYISSSGKLVITEHDPAAKKIKGTFEFTGIQSGTTTTKAFSKGSFSITYQ